MFPGRGSRYYSESSGRNNPRVVELELKFSRFEWADREKVGPIRELVDRLMFCTNGSLDVRAESLSWFLPPERGLWLPAGLEYEIRVRGGAAGCAVTLNGRFYGYPDQIGLAALSPRLQGLMADAADGGIVNNLVRQMIAKTLQMVPYEGILLPLVASRRLQPIVETLLEDPLNEAGIDDWAYRLDFDPHRMMRLFSRETGLSYQEWRHSARLMIAAEVIAQGGTVESAAFEVGYRSPDALANVFRHTFGVSPEEYGDRSERRRSAGS